MRLTLNGTLDRLFDRRPGALAFIVRTSLASLLPIAALILVLAVFEADNSGDAKFVVPTALSVLVIAPLAENLLLAGIVEFLLIFTSSRIKIVAINAIIFGVLHFFVTPWRGVTGFVGFAVMTYSYLLWYDSGFGRRYGITVAQHVLFNGLILAFIHLALFLDR